MYSIVEIIYGVPLTLKVSTLIERWEEDEDSPWFEGDDGPCGFVTLYNGGSVQTIGYCGVPLGRFDECQAFLKPADLPVNPTDSQIEEAKLCFDSLHPDIKTLLKEGGIELDTYYIFASS